MHHVDNKDLPPPHTYGWSVQYVHNEEYTWRNPVSETIRA